MGLDVLTRSSFTGIEEACVGGGGGSGGGGITLTGVFPWTNVGGKYVFKLE